MPRRLLRLAAPALLLAGCADGGYASSRSLPTSSDDTWSLGARLFRSQEAEVYELPAHPPALAERQLGPPGEAPGQRFPAFPVAGVRDPAPALGTLAPDRPVGAIEGHVGPAPLPPLAREPVAAWQPQEAIGAREPLGVRPVAAGEPAATSQPGSGLDRQATPPVAAWAEADIWRGDATPPTSPLR